MKSSSVQTSDAEIIKTPQTKPTKKSTKSRAKSAKNTTTTTTNITEVAGSSSSGSANSGIAKTATANVTNIHSIPALSAINMVNTPTAPTQTIISGGAASSSSTFDNTVPIQVNGTQIIDFNIPVKNPQKSYAGLEPSSIKCIWEQHNQSDLELQTNACVRLAEDVSYKLWEVINNIKIYARHSGGVVTYDLVNEVLRDMDVPPALGAMDSDWDRIDFDGSYFFHSDKILELRDEYQKEEAFVMSNDLDIICTQPLDDKNLEAMKKYVPSLIYVVLYGNAHALDAALHEVAFSPIVGATIRVLLTKIIHLLAFKQSDAISKRCWCMLRASSVNPHTNHLIYREEYFHLAEVLICQLLAPYESIKNKAQNTQVNAAADTMTSATGEQSDTVKMEVDDIKVEIKPEMDYLRAQQQQTQVDETEQVTFTNQPGNIEADKDKAFRLKLDNNDSDDEMMNTTAATEQNGTQTSSYFASPVDLKYVDDLCLTIGSLAAENGFFQRECIHHITRRLERFFDGRVIGTDKDYLFIGRSVRGLIALGEYAFKEFIPYLYKLNINALPDTLCREFLPAGVYLKGYDDIFLYEFLEHICGADKLQPYLLYYAHFHDKLVQYRYRNRKPPSYKIVPKQSVRRLEWNTLAAAMCHGDDPNKSLKPKPTIHEVFPELRIPNLQLNRSGTIRFKFAGCRPVILKNKSAAGKHVKQTALAAPSGAAEPTTIHEIGRSDILIARRKLYKPLTNDRYVKSPISASLSSYFFTSI